MNNSVGGWTVIMSNGLIKYRENFDEKLMKLGLLSQNKHQNWFTYWKVLRF